MSQPAAAPRRILVIDDSEIDRERIRRAFGAGAIVSEAATAAEGLARCEAEPPEVVLLDQRLPDADGVDLVAPLLDHGVAIVMLSGQGNEELAVAALQRGCHEYVSKERLLREGTKDLLESSIRHAMRARDLQTMVRKQQADLLRSETQLRTVIEHLPMTIWTTDHVPTVLSCFGAERTGPYARCPLGEAPWEHLLADHRAVLRGGQWVRVVHELGGRRYHAELRPLRAGSGVVTGVLGIARDVTDRQHELEGSKVRDATRVALAGAVADALRGGADAVAVAAQLDAVARRRGSQPIVLHPGELLAAEIVALGHRIGARVEVRPSVPTGLWPLRIDRSWLPEVFATVGDSVRAALPDGGSLAVVLENVHVQEPLDDAHGGRLAAGRYVGMVFRDVPRVAGSAERRRALEARAGTLPMLALEGLMRQCGGSLVLDGGIEGAEIRLLVPSAG